MFDHNPIRSTNSEVNLDTPIPVRSDQTGHRGLSLGVAVNRSVQREASGKVQNPPAPLAELLRVQLGAQLSKVESIMAEVLASQYAQVTELARRATNLGGKRLRPCLTLLAAMTCGKVHDDTGRVAAAVELVHAASLVHDDVLDNAAYRRHQPTVHAQIGQHSSIILGDYLFTRAYGLAAQCRSTFAARAIARAATGLCEGELRQQASMGNWNLSRSAYYDILRQKTGELCAVSCGLGAWSGGAKSEAGKRLASFGRKLGIAFQVVDDWLDFWGTPQVGKTLGTDLLQRKPTLPLIRLLETTKGAAHQELLKQLEAPRMDCAAIHELLDHSDASLYTLGKAKQLVRSALQELDHLPSSPHRSCLEAIAIQCVERTM